MARNGPTGQAAARTPPRRQPAEHDPFYVPPTSPPQNQWPPHAPGYPEQPQQPYPAHPFGQGHPQQGRPHEPQGFSHAPPYGAPQGQQGYPQQPGYPEPAPSGYGHPQGYPQHQGQPQGQGYYYPQHVEGDPGHAFAPQAPGQPMPYDRFPPAGQAGAPAANWNQLQSEQRGFDLGNYPPQAAEPPFQVPHDQFGPAQQGYGETDAEYDEAMADDEEEPRRGRRMMLIAAALVGAIGLGGAMAYTYKTFVASGGARAPLIKAADFGPNKVKPVVPGGKEIANTDKKLLNRLDDPNPPRAGEADPQEERATDDPNAPRRVRVIPITPGGQAPSVVTSVPPPSGPPMVPGLMIDNLGPPPARPQPPMARVQPPAQPSQPPIARATPASPMRVVTAAPPQAQSDTPPPVKKVTAAPKNPVPRVKEAAAPGPVVSSTSGTSGYVAVLSSKKSRMDALKAFADLQQKYGDVLASKTPDVQEANLGDKGMWYRAVVGPPGSRDGASSLCSQLKSAGFADCWVTAY